MIQPPQRAMCWALLAFLAAGLPSASVGEEKKPEKKKLVGARMSSGLRAPSVPLPESPKGVSMFSLAVEVNEKGEGQGTLTLNPNLYAIDDLGQIGGATTKLADIELKCSVKFVKMGKVVLGPSPREEEERFLYAIQGKNITSRLFLVTAGTKLGAAALGSAGWLIVKNKKGEATHFIPMHPPDIRPCHPGCFPAGTLVRTPTGPKAIEKIRAGDAVTVVRPDGASVPGKVQSVFVTRNRLLKVETENGHLFTTETQPLCLIDGTTEGAGNLKAGDKIYRWQDGKRQIVTVRSVMPTDRVEKVFNLILGDMEVFIAGGFLARSKPPAPTAQPSVPDFPGARE